MHPPFKCTRSICSTLFNEYSWYPLLDPTASELQHKISPLYVRIKDLKLSTGQPKISIEYLEAGRYIPLTLWSCTKIWWLYICSNINKTSQGISSLQCYNVAHFVVGSQSNLLWKTPVQQRVAYTFGWYCQNLERFACWLPLSQIPDADSPKFSA